MNVNNKLFIYDLLILNFQSLKLVFTKNDYMISSQSVLKKKSFSMSDVNNSVFTLCEKKEKSQ